MKLMLTVCGLCLCLYSNGILIGGQRLHLCWVKPRLNSRKFKKPILVSVICSYHDLILS